eukprot:TRINITY_DN16505_c0_g1_i1.p1 TRINITY_DN16505_c0_g1~~TRINITY_DN16505_c0_g1_i1.p1  ORF type:complete len:455 (+),score=65.60 TRINITY_DN16505_c0_g1_i1:2-1366(+)
MKIHVSRMEELFVQIVIQHKNQFLKVYVELIILLIQKIVLLSNKSVMTAITMKSPFLQNKKTFPALKRSSSDGQKHVCRVAGVDAGVQTKSSVDLKKLGDSDLVVSEVCLGTMTFGWQNSEAESHEIMSCAQEYGVNFFDTSELYAVPPDPKTQGKSSEILGTWLKKQKRDKNVVATKVIGRSPRLTWIVANRTVPKQQETGSRLDRKSIIQACDAELRRLQTDYIDLFQIHWPDRYIPCFGEHQYLLSQSKKECVTFEEQVLTMGELMKEGKIRCWGLSNETSYGVMMQCLTADRLGVDRPVTIQNSYSLIHRQFESELAETCAPHNFNVPLLPWSTLAGGALSGKYVEGGDTPQSRFNLDQTRWYRFHGTNRVQKTTKLYAELARKYKMTPAQLAYAFVRSKWFVGSTIVGGTSVEQIQENMGAFLQEKLATEILQQVQQIYVENRDPTLMD